MAPIFTGSKFGFGFKKDVQSLLTSAWNDFSNTATFSYTGSDQTWVVPAGTTKIGVMMWGAAGGSYYASTRSATDYASGGSGGYTEAVISVTPGETLVIVVGEGGQGINFAPATYGGGGKGGGTPRGAGEWGTAGGGLSGVFSGPGTVFTGATVNPPAIPRAILIAGGGSGYGLGGTWRVPLGYDSASANLNPDGFSLLTGGPYSYSYGNMYHGAGGGGLLGENGSTPQPSGANNPYVVSYPGGTASGGGSQTAGGTQTDGAGVDGQAGSQLRGGDAANSPYEYAGGGGGGGWYGGGGGQGGWPSPVYNPGGGGSGFIGNTSLTYGGSGSSENNKWTGVSPFNSREYQEAFTVIAPRSTSSIAPGNTPIYLSAIATPFYPGTSGKAPVTGSGALTGNPGYIVIRY